jgi:hypothetical protein
MSTIFNVGNLMRVWKFRLEDFSEFARPTDVGGMEKTVLWGAANDVADENELAPE